MREAAKQVVERLSTSNARQTWKLAEARVADPSLLYLEGQTFDVKIPRYVIADLMRALDG